MEITALTTNVHIVELFTYFWEMVNNEWQSCTGYIYMHIQNKDIYM